MKTEKEKQLADGRRGGGSGVGSKKSYDRLVLYKSYTISAWHTFSLSSPFQSVLGNMCRRTVPLNKYNLCYTTVMATSLLEEPTSFSMVTHLEQPLYLIK
jgi:hypothetical protein